MEGQRIFASQDSLLEKCARTAMPTSASAADSSVAIMRVLYVHDQVAGALM